jgi:hypothetical protein
MDTVKKGAEFIIHKIRSREPFFVGKLGSSELNILLFYTQRRQHPPISKYPSDMLESIIRNAGLFPATEKTIDRWANHMLTEVLPAGDGFAKWDTFTGNAEKALLSIFAPKSRAFPARSLEPYYPEDLEQRWTYQLPKDRKVAVISPFVKSIEEQWKKREAIWGDNPIWGPRPPAIIPIKAGYSPYLSATTGRWSSEIINGGWKAAVDDIVRQVLETGASFAIVGCGGLSLPICYALKQQNISSIHTGGATQILFGIKGRRWSSHEIISSFFNDAWVSPLPEETPTGAHEVEGACYW